MKYSKKQQEESLSRLARNVKRGVTVHAVIRSIAASGMSRVMDLFVVEPAEDADAIIPIGWDASRLMGYPWVEGSRGFRVTGCNTDLVEHVVRNLSLDMFGDYSSLRREIL